MYYQHGWATTWIAESPGVGVTWRVEFGYDSNASYARKLDNFAYVSFGERVFGCESSL